eukprot:gb/GECH01012033.1/.p1 GENE.gb/GECH01012033.1/~~gb/GECH01012033.1/.p1  ORF type:complete len:222 (+),score=42.63 gb/GECH01012033.1/:1-666(+)
MLVSSNLIVALFCIVVVAAIIPSISATYGVDISQRTSESAFSCLKNNGFDFAIVRGYHSTGRVDTAMPASVKNAWNGGMGHVDIYMFPCPKCGKSGKQQMAELVDYIEHHNVKHGMIWLDIEASRLWHGSCSQNQQFAHELASEANSRGVHLGVYTSEAQWKPIMCNWSGLSNYALWYAHYDHRPSFSDFRSFGGWSRPAIKQYVGDATVCGAGIDKDWYP